MPLNAIDGAALLILGALLVAFYYALWATPRARRDIPIVTNQRHDCNVTACIHPGTVIVRERKGGDTVHVCGGHWAEGLKRGWFQ